MLTTIQTRVITMINFAGGTIWSRMTKLRVILDISAAYSSQPICSQGDEAGCLNTSPTDYW